MNQTTDASFSCCGYSEYLGPHSDSFNNRVSKAISYNIPRDIWSKNHKLWQNDPNEISNRLGWLDLPNSMIDAIGSIKEFSQKVINDNFDRVLLFGMGGSSLGAEFFERNFSRKDHPYLTVVDTTSPDTISSIANSIDPHKTLVVISTKSGTTIETLSLMRYFYQRFHKILGSSRVGEHFVAITDPGSELQKIAETLNFRKVFLNDPNVGGRFSALSFFGLVPASLVGMDLEKLLNSAKDIAQLTTLNDFNKNVPLRLGLLIGYLATNKIDKMTIIISQGIERFAYWVEQMIAESLGKKGVGVLPVIEDQFCSNKKYGDDSFFVFFIKKGDEDLQKQLKAVLNKNKPVICIEIDSPFDFGGQIFGWEFATSVCGAEIGVNPFDQPDVEYSKKYAKDFVNEYAKKGIMSKMEPLFEDQGIRCFSKSGFNDLSGFKEWLLNKTSQKGCYLSIQAFISQSPEHKTLLSRLAKNLSMKLEIPVTFEFGPRYLHSTGQLHKGDAGRGVFVQFMSKPQSDLPIPDEPLSNSSSLTFGKLFEAQSLGDHIALENMGRTVVRIEFCDDVAEGLSRIEKLI